MKKRTSLVAIAVALSLTAGCASRRTADQLPPEPLSSTTPDESLSQDGDPSGTAAPGSRGHFLQNVPSDRVLFDFDSYSLDGEDRATLDAQAAYLARYPNVRVTIEGHADERGTREYNLALGDRRANAARDYLAIARRLGRPDAGDQLGQGAARGARIERSRLGPEPPRGDGGAGMSLARGERAASRGESLRSGPPARSSGPNPGCERLVEQPRQPQAAPRHLAPEDRDQPPGHLLGHHRPLRAAAGRRDRP